MKYVLLIVILLVLTILGFTVYRNYSGLFVKEQDEFSIMFANYDHSTPIVLTEKFYIDMDLSDYEQVVIDNDEIARIIQYEQNGELQFTISQTIVSGANSRINTEDAIILPQNITINDWSGIYYQSHDGCHNFIFNLGDCTISYLGFLDKNYMEGLVKSTKFV